MKAVIIMGSRSDLEYGREIAERLKFFGIESVMRVASAHKTPEMVLEIIREYENQDVVYVTIAGRSNALSGFVDANTSKPVIASPPLSERFAGMDLLSSINMPSGVSPMLVLYSENTALAVAKIIGLRDKRVEKRVKEYQKRKRDEVCDADMEAKSI